MILPRLLLLVVFVLIVVVQQTIADNTNTMVNSVHNPVDCEPCQIYIPGPNACFPIKGCCHYGLCYWY